MQKQMSKSKQDGHNSLVTINLLYAKHILGSYFTEFWLKFKTLCSSESIFRFWILNGPLETKRAFPY